MKDEIVFKDKYVGWNGFKGETWKKEINVSDFIDANYKEYRGDDSFLVSKSNFFFSFFHPYQLKLQYVVKSNVDYG